MTTIRNGPRVAAPITTSASPVRAPTTARAAQTGYASTSSFVSGGSSSGPVSNLAPPPQSLSSASTGTSDLSKSNPLIKKGVEALEKRGGADAKRLAELLKKAFHTEKETDELYGPKTGKGDERRDSEGLISKLGIESGSDEEKALAMRGVMEGFIKSMLAESAKLLEKLAEKPKPPPEP
jgi:hypothetical protein